MNRFEKPGPSCVEPPDTLHPADTFPQREEIGHAASKHTVPGQPNPVAPAKGIMWWISNLSTPMPAPNNYTSANSMETLKVDCCIGPHWSGHSEWQKRHPPPPCRWWYGWH